MHSTVSACNYAKCRIARDRKLLYIDWLIYVKAIQKFRNGIQKRPILVALCGSLVVAEPPHLNCTYDYKNPPILTIPFRNNPWNAHINERNHHHEMWWNITHCPSRSKFDEEAAKIFFFFFFLPLRLPLFVGLLVVFGLWVGSGVKVGTVLIVGLWDGSGVEVGTVLIVGDVVRRFFLPPPLIFLSFLSFLNPLLLLVALWFSVVSPSMALIAGRRDAEDLVRTMVQSRNTCCQK